MDDELQLTSLFSGTPPPEDTFEYANLTLSIARKEGKALTLLADQIFNPALVFAEQMELGIIDVVVCELGAGTGLPGLYAFFKGAAKVVLTEYPDENILDCLWGNLKRNVPEGNIFKEDGNQERPWCIVEGYDWGTDTTHLKRFSETYDVLFLADLLWYTSAYEVLLQSIVNLLAPDGKAWIGCGEYTTMEACERFMTLAKEKGLKARRIQLNDEWQGREKSSLTNLTERKRRVWLWEMQWKR